MGLDFIETGCEFAETMFKQPFGYWLTLFISRKKGKKVI